MIKFFKNFINNEKLQDTFESLAKLLFMLYTMLGFNSVMYGHKMVSLIMWPSFLLCAGVIGWRVLKFRQYYKMPGLFAAVIFVISHCLSSVLNIAYAFKDNIILAVYLAVFFFLFYVYPLKREPQKAKKEFELLAGVFVLYSLIGSGISIVMLINGYSDVSRVGEDNYEVVSGFRNGRLWGVFLEPNRAGLIMMIAVILLVYFFFRTKKVLLRCACAASVLPLFIYIVFSDSRTTIVSMFFAALGGTVMYVFAKKQKNAVSYISRLVVCVILSLVVAVSPVIAKSSYNVFVEKYEQLMEEQAASNNQSATGNKKPSVELPEIERNYDLSSDISNRRVDLWKDGFDMLKEKLLFGYSFSAIRPYSLEHRPDSYLVGNGAILFSNFHNEAINVLASQGIFGFLACGIFVAVVLLAIFKGIKHIRRENRLAVSVLTAVVIGFSAGAMFNSAMFYSLTPGVPIFWISLGYLAYIVKSQKADINGEL